MNINSGILVNFNQHPAKNLIEYIEVNTREQDDKLEANIDNVIYILDWNGVIQE
jgi:hypothetical protein